MCNIAEYIVMRRAAHIINSIIHKPENATKASYYSPTAFTMGNIIDSKPYVGPDDTVENSVLFQRRLEDLFNLVFEGCRVSRFVAIDRTADEFKDCNSIPLFLLEVYEPSHCYIPIYVVDDAVLAISPFNNEAITKVSRNPYIIELFPTSYILSTMGQPGIDALNRLLDETALRFQDERVINVDDGSAGIRNITRRQLISDMAFLFNSGITKQDALLTRGFAGISSDKVVEVSSESIYYKKMKAVYNMESLEKGEELGDGIIDPTDFMPIYLSTSGSGSSSGFAVLTDTKSGDKEVTKIAIKPQVLGITSDDSSIKAVLTKDNVSTYRYFMLELEEYYYIGNNRAVAFLNGELYGPVNLLEERSVELDDLVPEISNEGMMDKFKSAGSVMKNVNFVLKKFGLKAGSRAAGLLTQLFKQVGVKNVKWVMGQIAGTFKRGLDLEKADAIELQEKLLNDEIDVLQERISSYAKTWFKACTLSVFCGGLIAFPFAWIIGRARTKNARVRAIERLELRFDNVIERLERKINYAEERSENESVDQLIRERQMYQAARMRLLRMKDDAYGKDRIKYATFDKDLTMTSSQRIDEALRGGSTINLKFN